VSALTRPQGHRVSTWANQTTPWDDVQLDLVMEGRLTADGCQKEEWIQKEIERRLLLESKHTPPWFAVTPEADSVVDRALGTVTSAQQESKKAVMEEIKHKNTQAFHWERNPPDVLDLPPATAQSPQGKLEFKRCTVNKDQVKERECNSAHSADAKDRNQAQCPGLEDQSQHGPPCCFPPTQVSRDENNWALSAVWVDPSIKLQASQHSSQSKNSNMVGAGQASGVLCNVHLALEVAFPHLTQKGISHDTESSGSHELDGVCKGNKQTQNTGIGQNNLLSRYGKELRVVAEEVLGGKEEGLLWGRGSGLCAKQRRLVATRQLGDFLPKEGIKQNQSRRRAQLNKDSDEASKETAAECCQTEHHGVKLPGMEVLQLNGVTAVPQGETCQAQQNHYVLPQRPFVSGNWILPVPSHTGMSPLTKLEGILPTPEGRLTLETRDWQKWASGAGSQAATSPPEGGGSTLLSPAPSGGGGPRTHRDKSLDHTFVWTTPLREPSSTAGPSTSAYLLQDLPGKQGQLQSGFHHEPPKMQRRHPSRFSKLHAPQSHHPSSMLCQHSQPDMGGLQGLLGERVSDISSTIENIRQRSTPLLGTADVGCVGRLTDRIFRPAVTLEQLRASSTDRQSQPYRQIEASRKAHASAAGDQQHQQGHLPRVELKSELNGTVSSRMNMTDDGFPLLGIMAEIGAQGALSSRIARIGPQDHAGLSSHKQGSLHSRRHWSRRHSRGKQRPTRPLSHETKEVEQSSALGNWLSDRYEGKGEHPPYLALQQDSGSEEMNHQCVSDETRWLEEQLGSQADTMEMTEHLSMSPSHFIGFGEENLEVDLLDSTVGTIMACWKPTEDREIPLHILTQLTIEPVVQKSGLLMRNIWEIPLDIHSGITKQPMHTLGRILGASHQVGGQMVTTVAWLEMEDPAPDSGTPLALISSPPPWNMGSKGKILQGCQRQICIWDHESSKVLEHHSVKGESSHSWQSGLWGIMLLLVGYGTGQLLQGTDGNCLATSCQCSAVHILQQSTSALIWITLKHRFRLSKWWPSSSNEPWIKRVGEVDLLIEDKNKTTVLLPMRYGDRHSMIEIRRESMADLKDILSKAVSPSGRLNKTMQLQARFMGEYGDGRGLHQLRPLGASREPSSWEELCMFVRRAGFLDIWHSFRCGADSSSGAEQEVQVVSPMAYTKDQEWDAIDEALRQLRSAQPALPQPSVAWTQAAILYNAIDIQQMDYLQSRPRHPYHIVISPARVAALKILINRNMPVSQPLPSWVPEADWLAVRVQGFRARDLLMGEEPRGGFAQQKTDMIAGFRRIMMTAVPELQHLMIASIDQEMMKFIISRTVLRFDLGVSQHISITTILPKGAWRDELLTGQRPLSAGASVRLNSCAGFAEVGLGLQDGALLKALRTAMQADERRFCDMLASALSMALEGTFVQVRFSTEKSGKKQTFFDPGSSQSEIMVSLSLTVLLKTHRQKNTISLCLGFGTECPIEIAIDPPEPPISALFGILKTARPGPIRLLPLGQPLDPPLSSPHLVLGPFHKDWLSALTGRDSSREGQTLIQILEAIRTSVSGLVPTFVGRAGNQPFAVHLSCPNSEEASRLVAHYKQSTLHAIALAAFALDAEFLFESVVPEECLALMGEKGMRETISQWRQAGSAGPAIQADASSP